MRLSEVGVETSLDTARTSARATKPAKDFEALLIAQMMRSAHEAEDDEDSTSQTMWDVAAQHFSQVMANNGGFGLGRLIAKGMDK